MTLKRFAWLSFIFEQLIHIVHINYATDMWLSNIMLDYNLREAEFICNDTTDVLAGQLNHQLIIYLVNHHHHNHNHTHHRYHLDNHHHHNQH